MTVTRQVSSRMLRRHHAVRRNVQQGYFKALPLQGLEGMEHGMVLEFR